MRNGTVFVRLARVVTGMNAKYQVHFTFPMPRGLQAPPIILSDIEQAKKASEGVFGHWLKAVNLAPVKPTPPARKPAAKKA